MTEPAPLHLQVNGKAHEIPGIPPEERLLDTIRWRIGLKGTKEGCRSGDCGACTVLLDGRSVLSCLTLAHEAEGCAVETIESLAQAEGSRRVADAFARAGAVQCGYCTPGFVVAVTGLLRERKNDGPLSPEELSHELGGNLCRCTGYYGILRALGEVLGSQGAVATSEFEIARTGEPSPEPPRAVGKQGRRR
jgi:aerobic-type carbon monoxide dehydrogenase small subunit (CoxS/CutS family)